MLQYQDTMSIILTSFIVLCGCSASHSSVVVFDMFKMPMMKFPAREARFGPDISPHGLAGHLIYAEPNNACRPIKRPPTSVNGSAWIALVVRYHCNFDQKVYNAQQSGYDAVIVYNNGSEDLIDMNSDGRLDIEIPSVFVSQSSGRLLEQFHNRLNVTVVLYGSSDSMTFVYFIILGCIGGFGILFGICIVFVNYMCHRAKKRMSLLSKRKLKKLPIHKFKTGDRFDTCAICLDEYAEGDKLRVLPCGHAFHCNCIDVWLTEKMNTCPLCKDVVGRRGQPREVAGTTEEQRPLLLQSDDEDVGVVGVIHRGVDVTAEVHNPPAASVGANRRTYGSTGERPHPLAPTPSPSSPPASILQVHIDDDFLPDETVVHFSPVGPSMDPLGAGVVVVQSSDVTRGTDPADRHVV